MWPLCIARSRLALLPRPWENTPMNKRINEMSQDPLEDRLISSTGECCVEGRVLDKKWVIQWT